MFLDRKHVNERERVTRVTDIQTLRRFLPIPNYNNESKTRCAFDCRSFYDFVGGTSSALALPMIFMCSVYVADFDS